VHREFDELVDKEVSKGNTGAGNETHRCGGHQKLQVLER